MMSIRPVTPLMIENLGNLKPSLVSNAADVMRMERDFGFPIMLFPFGILYGERGLYVGSKEKLNELSYGLRKYTGYSPIAVRATETLDRAEEVMDKAKCPLLLYPYGQKDYEECVICLNKDTLKIHFNDVCRKSTTKIVLLIVDSCETGRFHNAGIF